MSEVRNIEQRWNYPFFLSFLVLFFYLLIVYVGDYCCTRAHSVTHTHIHKHTHTHKIGRHPLDKGRSAAETSTCTI